jgi:hypothetical protein
LCAAITTLVTAAPPLPELFGFEPSLPYVICRPEKTRLRRAVPSSSGDHPVLIGGKAFL